MKDEKDLEENAQIAAEKSSAILDLMTSQPGEVDPLEEITRLLLSIDDRVARIEAKLGID